MSLVIFMKKDLTGIATRIVIFHSSQQEFIFQSENTGN